MSMKKKKKKKADKVEEGVGSSTAGTPVGEGEAVENSPSVNETAAANLAAEAVEGENVE